MATSTAHRLKAIQQARKKVENLTTFENITWMVEKKMDKKFFFKSVFGYEDTMQYKKIDWDHFLHDRKKDLAK